ncbi:unnamed protein product [Arabidopsis halleri]
MTWRLLSLSLSFVKPETTSTAQSHGAFSVHIYRLIVKTSSSRLRRRIRSDLLV